MKLDQGWAAISARLLEDLLGRLVVLRLERQPQDLAPWQAGLAAHSPVQLQARKAGVLSEGLRVRLPGLRVDAWVELLGRC
jgi:hypothetical protein